MSRSLLWATWPCALLGTSGENRQRMSMGLPTRGTGNCSMYLPIAPISGSGLLPGALTSQHSGQPCPCSQGKPLQRGCSALQEKCSVRGWGRAMQPSHPLWGLTASGLKKGRCGYLENTNCLCHRCKDQAPENSSANLTPTEHLNETERLASSSPLLERHSKTKAIIVGRSAPNQPWGAKMLPEDALD